MSSLSSYKNDKKLKLMMVSEMKIHKKQDALIKGTYSKMNGIFKGCAVGCGVRSLNIKLGKDISYGDHAAYASELGIPEWLAHLEDNIFENLPEEESKKFPLEFLQAIPVGANLEPVQFKFKKFLLQENFERVQKLTLNTELKDKVLDAINQVIAVMDGAIETGKIDESAAESAAESAESAARSARSAAYVRFKNELIRLLKIA